MTIKYKNNTVEKLCTKEKEAKKFFNDIRYYNNLQGVLNYIEEAPNLLDVVQYPPFHFHSSDFYIRNSYALDIAGRKCKYRLIVIPLDDEEKEMTRTKNFLKECKSIKIIEIEEVSNHYE